jgi:hypothetical protein
MIADEFEILRLRFSDQHSVERDRDGLLEANLPGLHGRAKSAGPHIQAKPDKQLHPASCSPLPGAGLPGFPNKVLHVQKRRN